MAKKNPDLAYEGLGDITSLLHNQGISDLSWLSVDEEMYRASEALPKQNLDIIPDLQKALTMEDGDDVPSIIPLRPHTIVNSNPLDTPSVPLRDYSAAIRNRVAKLVMAGNSNKEIRQNLEVQFHPDEIRMAANDVREILSERGLLGNVYVNASHFPNAARDPKEKKLVQLLSKNAKYVIAGCGGCNGCNCHESGFCSTFGGKQVVSEVPYGPQLASHYANQLASQKRPVDIRVASSSGWKAAIQAAFLTPISSSNPDGIKTIRQQDKPLKPHISSQDVKEFLDRKFNDSGTEKPLSSSYLKFARRMATGSDDRDILNGSTDPELRSLASEYGLLGHSWIDMDAMGGCRQTLDLVNQKGLNPDFVLRRSSSCSYCHDALDGACAEISRCSRIVASKPEFDKQIFAFALRRASNEGRISLIQMQVALERAPENSDWKGLTRQANLLQSQEVSSEYSGSKVSAHYGTRTGEVEKTVIDPESVRRTISHLMNTGLHGHALQNAILQTYSRDDLIQVPQVGRRFASEDGIQGQYFIDPTAYSDYGKGCDEGAKSFRKRGAPHIMASSSCTGCTLQTAPGWCSKYAKTIIRTVPDQVRAKIASAKKHLPVVASEPVVDLSDQFELSSEIEVDLNGSKDRSISIDLNGPDFDD